MRGKSTFRDKGKFVFAIALKNGILRENFHKIWIRLCIEVYKLLLREVEEDLEK